MNTNEQTIHQMGLGISSLVKQATGRESVSNIDMDWVSVEQLARYIYRSGTGDVVSFETNIPDAIESLIAYITSLQDLHGYDNPWPGDGGKNLLGLAVSSVKTLNTNGTWNGNEYTLNGVTFKVIERDGYVESVECSGTASASSTLLLFNSDRAIELNEYIFSGCPSGGSSSTYRFIIKDVNSSSGGNNVFESGSGVTISDTFGIKRIAFAVYSDTTVTGKVVYPMLRLSSVTDDSFVPYSNVCPITGRTGCTITDANMLDSSDPDYHAETYSLTWQTEAGTIYGGTLDVLSGVLTVTHKSKTFVGAENEEWITADNAGYHIYRISVPDASFVISPSKTPVLCNIGKYAESGHDIGVCFIIPVFGVSSFYYYPPSAVDSVAKFKTWLESNNLQIVYQLAEPVSYTLTAQEVTALIGANNIFADTGNVSVEYKIKEDLL